MKDTPNIPRNLEKHNQQHSPYQQYHHQQQQHLNIPNSNGWHSMKQVEASQQQENKIVYGKDQQAIITQQEWENRTMLQHQHISNTNDDPPFQHHDANFDRHRWEHHNLHDNHSMSQTRQHEREDLHEKYNEHISNANSMEDEMEEIRNIANHGMKENVKGEHKREHDRFGYITGPPSSSIKTTTKDDNDHIENQTMYIKRHHKIEKKLKDEDNFSTLLLDQMDDSDENHPEHIDDHLKQEPTSMKKKRKRRKKRRLTKEELDSVVHLTQQEAADQLNICLSSLKRQFYAIYGRTSWRSKRRMKLNKEDKDGRTPVSPQERVFYGEQQIHQPPMLKVLDAESIMGNLLENDFEGLEIIEEGEEQEGEGTQRENSTIVKYGTHNGVVYNPYECPLNERTEVILNIPMVPECLNYDSFFETQKQVLITSGEGIFTNQGKKVLKVNDETAEILKNLQVKSPENVYSIIIDKYLNVYASDENFNKDYGGTLMNMVLNKLKAPNSMLTIEQNSNQAKPLYIREANTLDTEGFNISKFCIRNDIYSNMYYVGIINFWLSFPSRHSFIMFTDFMRVNSGVLQLFKVKLTKLGNIGLCMQFSPVNQHLEYIVTDKMKFKRPIFSNEITNHIVLCRLMQAMLTYAITLEAPQDTMETQSP